MDQLVAVFFLAAVNEAIVEFLGKPVLERVIQKPEDRCIVFHTISALGGMALALLFAVDALALLNIVSPVPHVGSVVTGLLLGRGANWIHDFVSRWIEPAKVDLPPLTGHKS